MNLFLCYTPLQLFIVSKIIKELKLKRELVEVFYISKVDGLVARNMISELSELSANVQFLHMRFKYPLYFTALLFRFFRRRYQSVYLASIDNVIMHFILSHIKFEHLYSFDDGTANIFPDSIYYANSHMSLAQVIYRNALGIRFTMPDIKSLSLRHFTIYPGFKNISERIYAISLMTTKMNSSSGLDIDAGVKAKACNVMLGSVYSFLFEPCVDIAPILRRCELLIAENGYPNFYIPHPRERQDGFFNDIIWIKPKSIAENEVLELLERYEQVNLYGFMSSCQFNLASEPRIVNHVFNSVSLIPTFRTIVTSGFLPSYFDVVDLD